MEGRGTDGMKGGGGEFGPPEPPPLNLPLRLYRNNSSLLDELSLLKKLIKNVLLKKLKSTRFNALQTTRTSKGCLNKQLKSARTI